MLLFVSIWNTILLMQIFESLHRRGVYKSLNIHIMQYGLTQNNKILQDVEFLCNTPSKCNVKCNRFMLCNFALTTVIAHVEH